MICRSDIASSGVYDSCVGSHWQKPDHMAERLPLSTVTLLFGSLSIPLAFLRHLCSLGVVLGVLAIGFSIGGSFRVKRRPHQYSISSVRNLRWGGRLAAVGTIAAIAMWVLWAKNFFF